VTALANPAFHVPLQSSDAPFRRNLQVSRQPQKGEPNHDGRTTNEGDCLRRVNLDVGEQSRDHTDFTGRMGFLLLNPVANINAQVNFDALFLPLGQLPLIHQVPRSSCTVKE
jgi:hypothetical protein